jgi:hypothetical protein
MKTYFVQVVNEWSVYDFGVNNVQKSVIVFGVKNCINVYMDLIKKSEPLPLTKQLLASYPTENISIISQAMLLYLHIFKNGSLLNPSCDEITSKQVNFLTRLDLRYKGYLVSVCLILVFIERVE